MNILASPRSRPSPASTVPRRMSHSRLSPNRTNRRPMARRRMSHSLVRTICALASVAACAATLFPAASATAATPRRAAVLVSRSRCAANRAAGTITYLTGFSWQASVGILDPIAAEAQGFYSDLCLKVRFEPGNGDPTSSAQLVDAGKVTITELGSPEDAIADVAGTPSIPVDAIATYGNATIDVLLTMPSITNLRQLDGKTIGYKGSMPPDITAMLQKAGVRISSLKEVAVGYDPTILPRGQVQGLTAYKSNEPVQLSDAGYKVREWDPASFGIKGAFNVFDVNRAWAKAHPGTVEDFLRATFKAFSFCISHATTCVRDAAKYQVGYNVHQNVQRWMVESGIVRKTLLPGHGVGYEDTAQWLPSYQLMVRSHLIRHSLDLASIVDPRYLDAIYRGRSLIWPGP
jgi:ABC-type nitrate/sulfonate/bicarbonate transport system substrate-binding protein